MNENGIRDPTESLPFPGTFFRLFFGAAAVQSNGQLGFV